MSDIEHAARDGRCIVAAQALCRCGSILWHCSDTSLVASGMLSPFAVTGKAELRALIAGSGGCKKQALQSKSGSTRRSHGSSPGGGGKVRMSEGTLSKALRLFERLGRLCVSIRLVLEVPSLGLRSLMQFIQHEPIHAF